MNREHGVPLSPWALEVLDATRMLADGNPLVSRTAGGTGSEHEGGAQRLHASPLRVHKGSAGSWAKAP